MPGENEYLLSLNQNYAYFKDTNHIQKTLTQLKIDYPGKQLFFYRDHIFNQKVEEPKYIFQWIGTDILHAKVNSERIKVYNYVRTINNGTQKSQTKLVAKALYDSLGELFNALSAIGHPAGIYHEERQNYPFQNMAIFWLAFDLIGFLKVLVLSLNSFIKLKAALEKQKLELESRFFAHNTGNKVRLIESITPVIEDLNLIIHAIINTTSGKVIGKLEEHLRSPDPRHSGVKDFLSELRSKYYAAAPAQVAKSYSPAELMHIYKFGFPDTADD